MDWLKTFHDDHKDVLILLAKLEGNVMDLKAGLDTPNTFVEFREFGDIIKNVLLPHFKQEETGIYKKVGEYGSDERTFIDNMLQEHEALYSLFAQYLKAVDDLDKGKLIEIGATLGSVLTHHITKEEDTLPHMVKPNIE